jgi:hypothetical protein
MSWVWRVYDSDGNLVGEAEFAAQIGAIVATHHKLVESTTRLNAELGIGPADEPFLTVTRECRPDASYQEPSEDLVANPYI